MGPAAVERAGATFVFTGSIEPAPFVAFVRHRAARLDLTASTIEAAPDRVSVTVRGAPEMIEAFAMACSLGPLCCLVLDVTRGRA